MALRGEGMATRKERLAKIKKGPGTFVYMGKACDTEWTPTIKRNGRKQAVLDDSGIPVVDSSGRQIFEPAGQPMKDHNGRPVLGGIPEIRKIPIETMVLWGVEFPAGQPISVEDDSLALKLRCLPLFKEVEPGSAPIPVEAPVVDEPAKRKPGRPKKSE